MTMLIRIALTLWLLTVVYDETGWATTLTIGLMYLWSEVVGFFLDGLARKTP
jgi:hypothetical protein